MFRKIQNLIFGVPADHANKAVDARMGKSEIATPAAAVTVDGSGKQLPKSMIITSAEPVTISGIEEEPNIVAVDSSDDDDDAEFWKEFNRGFDALKLKRYRNEQWPYEDPDNEVEDDDTDQMG